MREELRILLPGAQMLTAFPIILPFNQGFARIQRAEQWVYLVTYVCAIGSLVCLRAPAAQHRIERPLRRPVRFKQLANRLIVAGLAFLSLVTHLVVTMVIGGLPALLITALVALAIVTTWWLLPVVRKVRGEV